MSWFFGRKKRVEPEATICLTQQEYDYLQERITQLEYQNREGNINFQNLRQYTQDISLKLSYLKHVNRKLIRQKRYVIPSHIFHHFRTVLQAANWAFPCPICYQEVIHDCIAITPCGHIFHPQCLEPVEDLKCPTCRYECLPSRVEQLAGRSRLFVYIEKQGHTPPPEEESESESSQTSDVSEVIQLT